MPVMTLSGYILLTETQLSKFFLAIAILQLMFAYFVVPRSFMDTASELLSYILQFILNELMQYVEEEQFYSEEMLGLLIHDSQSDYPTESLEYYRHFVKVVLLVEIILLIEPNKIFFNSIKL